MFDMLKGFLTFLALAGTLASSNTSVAKAQAAAAKTTATVAAASPARAAAVMLPGADAVMFVDLKRLFADVIPRVLVESPARLAEVNTDIDQFRAKTGIDPRAFDRITLSFRFAQTETNATRAETVAVAHGTFNAGTLVAAGRLAAKGKYQEQKLNGKTIYIFSLNEQLKMFGLFKMNVADVAIAALDTNTLAIGSPETVRTVLENPNAGGAAASSELVGLASQNAGALVGFGANVPPALLQNLDLGNEEIVRSVGSVRQLFGSIGMSGNNFDLLTVLRTDAPDRAQNLSETLSALKQFAPLLSLRFPGSKSKAAQDIIDSLQITNRSNEVELKLIVEQPDINSLLNIL
ncbi:MAG: hypothetical protein WKF84_16020 [Pyrinomonadaceae bacterium]